MTIIAAADGSALGNPGPAGWCWYIDEDSWAAGGWPSGTNNRGELTAVAELLDATAHRTDEPLEILCDSQYVINSVTKWMAGWKRKGWKKRDGKPVLNVDLMQRLDAAMVGRKVTFTWVKGHSGHELNEAADQRARAAATAHQKGLPVEPGPGFAGDPRDTRRGQASPGLAPDTREPDLFDDAAGEPAAADRDRGEEARRAHRTLARAIGRLIAGDGRRARFLTRGAVLVPAIDAVDPAFVDAEVEIGVVAGDVAVTVARAADLVATCTWEVAGEPRLVALHAGRP
ncbi:ribonuclease H family protein [Corynebacterium sphenisci]|uniref:ribonuclease H family protein n=1 Tax=Corynebacterium sphenisci TaxID=191493 RepID=UPI000AA92251|nr:ribonuclease H [Corynebacterium sphenisci]